ncbi:hypothetical protein L350_07298 [Enterobacter sp. MGH 4]|nr:hypothetical protein L359_05991 [Enterobacter hormaechei subsp. hoffmannii MGH 13]EUM92915.1 hypothetical protein L350_07298 [Enterobacter sp. MGH 4]
MPSPQPSPTGLRVPHKIMPAQTAPSPLRERAGVRGNIRLWWSFRSLYVPCYSVTTWPVNVPGWLSRHHPGDPGFRRKIAASRCLRLIPSGLSGTGGGNIPVKPALSAHPCASPRPTGNASAIYSRTEASLKALSYSEATLSLLLSNYWGTLYPRREGELSLCRPGKA